MNDSGQLSVLESVEGLIITTTTLMICDAAGSLRAVSAASTTILRPRGRGKSTLRRYLGATLRYQVDYGAYGEARKREDYSAQRALKTAAAC